jgi:hypothetical protein
MNQPPARILSTNPFTYTRVPVLLLVGIAAVLAVAAGPDLDSLALLAVMAAVAYVAIRMTAGDFADKVSDGGDHLLVRIGKEEERILFSHIESVEQSNLKPPRITLKLRYAGKFGHEIVFIPAGLFTDPSWRQTAVLHELEERVRAAQEGR